MIEVSVEHVSFSYVPEHPVLTDVSVAFGPGTTAVIGQNGAGKTTLMKLLNGLLKPESGRVRIGDVDTKGLSASDIARQVGLVFQNPDTQIFKHNVKDEVEFGPNNIGKSAEESSALALEALKLVGLQEMLHENPYDLSYAERKKICVASVLAMGTDVVVLDEPTISQDAEGLTLMGSIIRRLGNEGKTVVAIVHDMNFAAEHFDRLVVMAEGQVLAAGAVGEVFQNEEALARAHVEPPSMGKLSRATGMKDFSLTVDDFVASFSAQTKRSER